MVKTKSNSLKKEETRELLRLAVNCRFITADQEKELLPKLLAYSEKRTKNMADDPVAGFFLQEKILSKEKIDLFRAVKNQLETLTADKKFGKLGVANNFVTPESIQKALDMQVAIFRKERKTVKIGDILVDNNDMSLADKTAVLLTQNRIRDEFIADALTTIAKSETEKKAINKRFGTIAVKRDLISPRQLEQALRCQAEEIHEKGERRHLGEILKDLFGVADTEIKNILTIQKLFEAKRLNLNKKLNQIPDYFFTTDFFTHPSRSYSPAIHNPVIKKIEGDIVSDTIDVESILNVDGNIIQGISVSCHQLSITGNILGNVTASGDIDVKGNIGRYPEPDGLLSDVVQINTNGSVHVSHSIINAKIVALKGITAQNSGLTSSLLFSSGDIAVKNIVSTQTAPSILRIVRPDFFQIETLSKIIKQKTRALDKISHKSEMDRLTKELMEQVQVQNAVLEKQNVILYLRKIIEDPGLENIENLAQKVETYEKNNRDTLSGTPRLSIPENTKAHYFMRVILEKIQKKHLKDQKTYIRGLHDNIADLYTSAVDNTERINEKYEVRSKEIETQIERIKPRIDKEKQEIDVLLSQKKSLQIKQKKDAFSRNPVIKVKNQIGRYTVVQGESASRIIDQPIYGISIREDYDALNPESGICIEGYFA